MIDDGDPGGAEDPPRPEILASWQRSRRAGVDPTARTCLLADPAGDTRLHRAGHVALDTVTPELATGAIVLLLADGAGRVLHRTATTEGFADALDDAGLVVGRDLAETTVGTNAVGTALVMGERLTVIGSEHYHDAFQTFAGV